MPAGRCRCRCPCRCATLVGSPSKRSRQRRGSACARPRPSGTRGPAAAALRAPDRGCAGVSGSKVRIESTSSSNRSTRYGTAEPIGNRSISPPRTAYSPGDDDLAHVGVAGERQLAPSAALVERVALLEVEGVAGQEARRRQAVQRRRRRHQHDDRPVDCAADAPQRRQALGDQVLVRREACRRAASPSRGSGDAQARREERISSTSRCASGASAAMTTSRRRSLRAALRRSRQQQRIGRARRPREGKAGPCDR